MRRKVIIPIIALITIMSLGVFLSSCNLADVLGDLDLGSIWEVFGYNKPANLKALTVSDSQIYLSWEDKVTGEDGFVIEVTDQDLNETEILVDKNTTEYYHTPLDSNTLYIYEMYAYDDAGQSDPSNQAFAKTDLAASTEPDVPTNLQAAPVSDTKIDLSWDDNSSNEDGFKVYRSPTSGGPYSLIDTTNPNVSEYTDAGLTPETIYYYKVSATNSFGDSSQTAETSATTLLTPSAVPDAPTNLQAAAVSNMRIDLTWTDNSGDEEAFVVLISTNNSTFSTIGEVKPNVTTYQSTSLKPETTYYYRIYATNSTGDSAVTESAKARTLPTPGTMPEAPSNLQAKAVSDSQIAIGWTDNSVDEDGFNVFISKDEGEDKDYYWVDKVKPNVNEYLMNGLGKGVTYYFKVSAFNFFGETNINLMNPASATTLSSEIPPVPPSGLVAKTVSDSQIAIAWNDNSDNEEGFNIFISKNGVDFDWFTKVKPDTGEYLVGGLPSGYQFWFKVNAYNRYGSSALTDSASAWTGDEPDDVPAAPTNLVAKAASDTRIVMAWTDNSDNEDGFNIEVSENGLSFYFLDKVEPDRSEYSLDGLKPNLTLYFRVNAYNRYGKSEYTNVAKATTLPEPSGAPAAPANLVAKALSTTQVVIGWMDNSDNEDGFNIVMAVDYDNTGDPPAAEKYRWIETVKPGVKEFVIEGLKPDITFWFKVQAFNAQGESLYSNAADARTPAASGAPAAPTNLVAKAASDTQIELGWTDNSDNEEAFILEIKKEELGTFSFLDKIKPDTTGYAVGGLRPNAQYWFRLFAVNGSGESVYSNEATATTKPDPGTVPLAPTNLVAKALSHTQVVIAWSDNSDNEDGFNVEISLDGVKFEFFDKTGPDMKEYVAEGLKPEITFYFRMNAFNSSGGSEYSNVAKATTLPEPTGVPEDPSGLIAKTASDTVIEIQWTDNSGDEDAFNIEISVGTTEPDPGDYKWLDKVKPDTTYYKVGGLKPATQFWFRVNAVNGEGESGYTDPVTATTNSTPGSIPADPTSLIAVAKSDSVIALGWTDNSDNEEGFNVEISLDGEKFEFFDKAGANVREYAAEGLKPETTYYFRVTAFNSSGPSENYTNTAKAATLPEPTAIPDPPAGLDASVKSDSVIGLVWKDMSDNEDGFGIEFSGNGSDYKFVDKVPTNVSEYVMEGLKPNTTYFFRVNAFNGEGASDYCTPVSATTQPEPSEVPAAPSTLGATAKSDSVIVLTWTDNSDNEEFFVIEVGPNGSTWETLDKVKADGVEYIVEGLKPTTTYYFRILAANGEGNSTWSNTANDTTLESPSSSPAAPTELTATAVGDLTIIVAWTDNSSVEEGFFIEWGPDGERWDTLDKLPPDSEGYKKTGLKNGVTYYFRVKAYNKAGESAYADFDYATAYEK